MFLRPVAENKKKAKRMNFSHFPHSLPPSPFHTPGARTRPSYDFPNEFCAKSPACHVVAPAVIGRVHIRDTRGGPTPYEYKHRCWGKRTRTSYRLEMGKTIGEGRVVKLSPVATCNLARGLRQNKDILSAQFAKPSQVLEHDERCFAFVTTREMFVGICVTMPGIDYKVFETTCTSYPISGGHAGSTRGQRTRFDGIELPFG